MDLNNVLILDDEMNIRKDLDKHLSRYGYKCSTASTLSEASCILRTIRVDYAIVDLKIDHSSEYGGIDFIIEMNRLQPKAQVVVLSAWERNPEIDSKLSTADVSGYIHKGGQKNYIIAVLDILKKLKSSHPPKRCFVIMPFSTTNTCTEEEWSDIYENTIKRALTDSGYTYDCYRASLSMGNIIKDILDNLNRADVVIADLTDRNPNVYYELGVRHALRDSSILITQRINDVPFDLRHYALIEYKWKTQKGRDKFAENLRDALEDVEENRVERIISPVREYLKLAID